MMIYMQAVLIFLLILIVVLGGFFYYHSLPWSEAKIKNCATYITYHDDPDYSISYADRIKFVIHGCMVGSAPKPVESEEPAESFYLYQF